MATAFHTLASTGVTNTGTNLAVTAEGSTMRVLVGYGSAMIEGFYYQLRDDGGAVQTFTHTTEAELGRIDRIVLRLDLTARTISLVKLIGTAASTPEAPALTRNEETYEISLAKVLIRAAAQELLASDITDERENDDVCGLIAPEALRRATIAQMIDDAIDQALDEEMADVLRFSAQTLQTAQQAQARGNIDAQQKITASGMLKGNGAGGVSAAVEGTDYAGISGVKLMAAEASSDILSYTASHVLVLSDAGRLILMSSASAQTVTIPANASVAFPIDTEIEIVRWNTGSVTISPASGVTLASVDGLCSIGALYGAVSLKKVSTDIWLLTGYVA